MDHDVLGNESGPPRDALLKRIKNMSPLDLLRRAKATINAILLFQDPPDPFLGDALNDITKAIDDLVAESVG